MKALIKICLVAFIAIVQQVSADIVYGNVLVENTTGVTQTYQYDFFLPVTSPADLIRGSIDTSVIGPNALLEAPALGSVYTALIDGVAVRTLQDAPFALGTGQDATTQFDEFIFEPNGFPATTDIGIRLTFTLSDGATAVILSDFEVIPEPASAGLIALVGGGALFVRRRFMLS